MKTFAISLLCALSVMAIARADLSIVQKIEGAPEVGNIVTIKIKGDKARIEVTPKITTIIDRKTGDVTTLMNEQKRVVRISAETMRTAAQMMNQFAGKGTEAAKPKLKATGKKQNINGYETEEYVCETPNFQASYWIAANDPNSAGILKQLQTLNMGNWQPNNKGLPDYSDFPGLPIKMVVSVGGRQITTTLVSVKQDPLSNSEFIVPAGFQELKMPSTGILPENGAKKPVPSSSPH